MIVSKKVFAILLISLMSSFFLGAYALENIGIQYVSEGGSPLVKIHIYSYLIMAMFLYHSMKYGVGNYVKSLGEFVAPWLVAMSCIVFVILYGLYHQGLSGMAYLVDLVLTPLLLMPLLFALDSQQKRMIVKVIGYLVFFNACLAIIEFAANRTLLDVEFSSFSHFRSTAFLTHPLNNALVTVSLALLLFNKTRIPSFIYLIVILIALFAFGGRGSTAIFIFAAFLMVLPSLIRFLTVGVPMQRLNFAFYQAAALFSLLLVIYVIFMTPVGDRILSKLHVDGSAQARFDVFILLEQLTINEWMLGASNSLKNNIEFFIGINVIENYLIGWVLTFGLIGAIPLLFSVFLMPFIMVRHVGSDAKYSLFVLFLVSLTNNALSAKSMILLFFLVVIICLLRNKNETI